MPHQSHPIPSHPAYFDTSINMILISDIYYRISVLTCSINCMAQVFNVLLCCPIRDVIGDSRGLSLYMEV